METSSQGLSQKIIERLVREKLLSDQHGKKLLPKFISGKLTQEDWRLAVELSEAEQEEQS